MPEPDGFTCACCGSFHPDVPMNYSAAAPDVWSPELDDDPESVLGPDQCVIRGEHFLVRGNIHIPVHDAPVPFSWGVWVSLSRENFGRAMHVWETPGRESEPPYFAWLCTSLPMYDDTTRLATNLHTQPVGTRPFIEVEPTDHPLAVEQREGITMARVREFAAILNPAP